METEYFIVENADSVREQDSDKGANADRISLPVVAGPFDTWEHAVDNISKGYHEGQMVVTVPKE